MIGNGSIGNVKVYQYAYYVAGRKGTGCSLTAIQITDLIEYKGGSSDDFVAIESEAPSASPVASDSVTSGDLF
jgi:hypothetical protein